MQPFVQIIPSNLSLACGLRILRAEDYQSSLTTEELISAAKQDAERSWLTPKRFMSNKSS